MKNCDFRKVNLSREIEQKHHILYLLIRLYSLRLYRFTKNSSISFVHACKRINFRDVCIDKEIEGI